VLDHCVLGGRHLFVVAVWRDHAQLGQRWTSPNTMTLLASLCFLTPD
jgi:hypothetical protein